MENYKEEYRDDIEFFLDNMESILSIYYENIRIRNENKDVKLIINKLWIWLECPKKDYIIG